MLDILKTNEEYDVVAAYQKERNEGKVLTFFKDSFYKLINSVSSVRFVKGASDFRTFRRVVVDAILEVSEYNRFSKGIFSFVGFNTYYLPYKVEERRTGTTKWSFTKLFNYAIEGIIGFTVSPLRLPFFISIILFLTSLITLIIFLITGIGAFETLLVVMLFIMGVLFVTLGIMGEYLSKAYLEVKNRPVYILKNVKYSKKK